MTATTSVPDEFGGKFSPQGEPPHSLAFDPGDGGPPTGTANVANVTQNSSTSHGTNAHSPNSTMAKDDKRPRSRNRRSNRPKNPQKPSSTVSRDDLTDDQLVTDESQPPFEEDTPTLAEISDTKAPSDELAGTGDEPTAYHLCFAHRFYQIADEFSNPYLNQHFPKEYMDAIDPSAPANEEWKMAILDCILSDVSGFLSRCGMTNQEMQGIDHYLFGLLHDGKGSIRFYTPDRPFYQYSVSQTPQVLLKKGHRVNLFYILPTEGMNYFENMIERIHRARPSQLTTDYYAIIEHVSGTPTVFSPSYQDYLHLEHSGERDTTNHDGFTTVSTKRHSTAQKNKTNLSSTDTYSSEVDRITTGMKQQWGHRSDHSIRFEENPVTSSNFYAPLTYEDTEEIDGNVVEIIPPSPTSPSSEYPHEQEIVNGVNVEIISEHHNNLSSHPPEQSPFVDLSAIPEDRTVFSQENNTKPARPSLESSASGGISTASSNFAGLRNPTSSTYIRNGIIPHRSAHQDTSASEATTKPSAQPTVQAANFLRHLTPRFLRTDPASTAPAPTDPGLATTPAPAAGTTGGAPMTGGAPPPGPPPTGAPIGGPPSGPPPPAPAPAPTYHTPPGPAPGPSGGGYPGPPPAPAIPPPALRAYRGVDWREHRLDPAAMEGALDRDTHTIRPWLFPRPEMRSRLNHGTRFNCFTMARRPFLANFGRMSQLADSGRYKSFMYSFPKLPPDATPSDMLFFLSSVSSFAAPYGVYVPPPFTLDVHSPLGRWWPDVDPLYTNQADYYDNVLYQALTQKAVGLLNTPEIAHIYYEGSGYRMLYRIAYYGGHPILNRRSNAVAIPRQKSDMSLIAYRKAWEHFLQVYLFMGVVYSDRYFVECFAENLHSMYSKNLCPYLITQVRRLPVNEAVPRDFTPLQIVEYMGSLCQQVGVASLQPMATPRELLAREPRRSPRPSSGPPRPRERPLETRELDFLSNEDLLFVHQLATSGRKCDLCRDPDHYLRECPHLASLRDDAGACRRIFSAIRDIVDNSSSRRSDPRSRGGYNNSRGRRPPARPRDDTPPASNRTPPDLPTRQIDEDADTVDGDASTLSVDQLTDDESAGYDTDGTEDFRTAGD